MIVFQTFTAHLPREVASALGDPATVEAALSAAFAEGRASWPGMVVKEDAWARAVAERIVRAEVPGVALASLRPSDAYLAFAAVAGNAKAVAEIDRRLVGGAPQALLGLRLGGVVTVDEILQRVRVKVLVRDGDQPARLTQYSCTAPLDAWLAVVVTRTALSELRRRDPLAAREDDVDALVGGAVFDPALESLRERSAPTLRRAIEEAIESLPSEDRALMRLHFVDGLTIDDLGALYQVHRATAARRLARIRAHIFDEARGRAMSALGLSETEFASLMGVMLSRIDVTLQRLLTP